MNSKFEAACAESLHPPGRGDLRRAPLDIVLPAGSSVIEYGLFEVTTASLTNPKEFWMYGW